MTPSWESMYPQLPEGGISSNLISETAFFKEAAAGRPENPEVIYHLGFAHHKVGEFQETLDVLTRALSMNPDFPMANEAATVLDELR